MFTSSPPTGVRVGYALPAPVLRSYVSTYSLTVVEPGCEIVFDQVYPEWANVRLSADGRMAACTGPGPLRPCDPQCGIGPTSHSTHFSLTPGSYWTISLLPLGWARLVGRAADAYADRWEIVSPDSVYARFAPLLSHAAQATGREDAVRRFDKHLRDLINPTDSDDEATYRAHMALLDPAVATVAALADRAGLSIRSLERLARTNFGFAPKLLLRRQRFLRSLSQFMLDPSLAWIDTMDTHYVDQAHFIRDFRRFMDSTPRAYAACPHPVLWAAARARAAVAGKAMQVLQAPLRTDSREPLR